MKKLFFTILILCLFVSFGLAQHKAGAHKSGGLAALIDGAAQGDIIYWDGTDWVLLNIGSNTYVLTSNGTIPTWAAGSSDSVWSSITLGRNGLASGQLNFIASDNDQGNIAITTNDALLISGFSDGLGIGLAPINNYQLTMLAPGTDDVGIKLLTNATGSTGTDGFNFGIENATQKVFINQREAAAMLFLVAGANSLSLFSGGDVAVGATAGGAQFTVDGNKTTDNILDITNADDGAVGSDSTAYFDKLGDLWMGDSNASVATIDTVETAGSVVRWVKFTVGGVDFFAVADTSITVN